MRLTRVNASATPRATLRKINGQEHGDLVDGCVMPGSRAAQRSRDQRLRPTHGRSQQLTRHRIASVAVGVVLMLGIVIWLLIGSIGQTWSPGVGTP